MPVLLWNFCLSHSATNCGSWMKFYNIGPWADMSASWQVGQFVHFYGIKVSSNDCWDMSWILVSTISVKWKEALHHRKVAALNPTLLINAWQIQCHVGSAAGIVTLLCSQKRFTFCICSSGFFPRAALQIFYPLVSSECADTEKNSKADAFKKHLKVAGIEPKTCW